MKPLRVANLHLCEGDRPFFIAGPCVVESERHCLKLAERLAGLAEALRIDLIFKASYDKANRTSVNSYRGPGMREGLRILAKVKPATGLPVLSDVHESAQVGPAAEVCDVLQIPAFLCRQTDLVVAAASTGRAVNLKKGSFMSPAEMRHVLAKAAGTGNRKILLTERGTCFGYNNLVVDFRSLVIMRALGQPVVFDATHSVQKPGGGGDRSEGEARFIPFLARAAAAVGADGFFFEVHDHPERALSDGPNALRLQEFPRVVEQVLAVCAAAPRRP